MTAILKEGTEMKKYLSLILIAVLALALTACGGKLGGEEAAPDDGQNPVMNYVGNYVCGRASVLIGAEDEKDGASASVTWSSSAAENSTWEMTGIFDPEEKRFEYHDCVRTDFVYKEDGSVDKQTEVYTGGHGFMFFDDSGDKLTMTWQDDQEDVAKDMVFEFATAPAEGEASTGMANPWQTADSSEAAAQGAGLDGFSVPDDITLSSGEVKPEVCRYMDGLAEVSMPVGAVEMTIRKGRADVATDGDISGDYNEYAHTWTQNIKGLEVTCFGNRDGEATKTIWQVDDSCFAILAYGAGGDDDFGLNPDDINSLINSIQ
jgi:hypothetical protein